MYLDIFKITETASSVEYRYVTVDLREGRFSIHKETGEVALISLAPGESEEGRLFHRAAHKIRKSWTSGSLPDKTYWAS